MAAFQVLREEAGELIPQLSALHWRRLHLVEEGLAGLRPKRRQWRPQRRASGFALHEPTGGSSLRLCRARGDSCARALLPGAAQLSWALHARARAYLRLGAVEAVQHAGVFTKCCATFCGCDGGGAAAVAAISRETRLREVGAHGGAPSLEAAQRDLSTPIRRAERTARLGFGERTTDEGGCRNFE
eukprot:scaffold1800_cov237-Pinguiococcus_pyrenoidosus.AAC.15